MRNFSWKCEKNARWRHKNITKSWDFPHNIIILRFCNIVKGQANYLMANASSNSKNREAAQFLWPNFLLNVALSLEGTSIRLVRKSWIASTTRSVLYCVKGKLENEPLFFQNIWQIVIFLWLNANCYNHGDIKTASP